MNVDDGVRRCMAGALAIFTKGHVVTLAQVIYLRVLGNGITSEVDFDTQGTLVSLKKPMTLPKTIPSKDLPRQHRFSLCPPK